MASNKSRLFARAQTALLCAFTALFFLDRTPVLASIQSPSIGTALCVAGLLLMIAAFVSLRAVIQIAPQPKPDGHLVTSGPYQWLRHPIYTGMLALFIGLFLRKPTAPIGIASAAIIVFLIVKSRFEEQLLEQRYPEYRQYKTRSWGIIPGLR